MIHINASSPLYKQIANKIKDEILGAGLTKDDAIPSEIKLSNKYNVSRVTIRQAIDLLVKEGLLYKIKGSGTYVNVNKIEHNIYKLQGFTEEMMQLNKVPINKILDFQMMHPNQDIQKILNLEEEDKVFFVRRLRFVDEEPVVLEETYMPVKLFPDLSLEVMQSSKYAYIERKGFKIKESFREIIPLLPDAQLKKTLQLKDLIPILSIDMWSSLEDNRVFEYTKLYFRSDRYSFKLISTRQ